jgi:hypothetical protein
MVESREGCLKCVGREIWNNDVSEIWKLSKTPPEIWYVKTSEEFNKRYDKILSKIPEFSLIDRWLVDTNQSSHVQSYINTKTLKEYHEPIVVIVENEVRKHERYFEKKGLALLNELAHELNERALIRVNPYFCYGIPIAQKNVLNCIREKNKLEKEEIEEMVRLGIAESIRHSFVNEGVVEVLNRRGLDGKDIILGYYDAKIEESRQTQTSKRLSVESVYGPAISDILSREILAESKSSVKDLRERAEARKLELTEEEYEKYQSVLTSCIKKIGYQF